MFHVGKSKVSSEIERGSDEKELKQFSSSTVISPVEMDVKENPFVTTTCRNCAKQIPEANEENDNNADTIEEFASSTTMHGVSFYYSSRSKPMKVFWIFLLVGMAAMLTYQLVDRIIVYFEYETNTSITQEFVAFLPFPAVTICTFNRFYINAPNEAFLNAIYGFNQLITPENVAVNEILEKAPNLTDIESNLINETIDGRMKNSGDNRSLDVKLLLKKYGFSLDESTMPRCVYKYEDCVAEDFTQILTWMGACYTFNNNGNVSKIQRIPGAGHGFSATINIQKELITEEPIFGLRDLGLRIQIHQRGDTPDVGSFGISIPAGTKASIEITRRDYNLMYRPWGRCDPSREKLVYFDVYTLECYTNALLEHCGCYLFTQYWAEGFGRECTAEEMQTCASEYLIEVEQYYSAETCNCTVPCSSTQYDTSISYATFPNPPTTTYIKDLLGFTEEETLGNAVEFDIYYKTMSYSKFTQSKKVDESGLLSDMGGQLGLWLGMSIITAVEIVQFCAKKVCGCRKKKRT